MVSACWPVFSAALSMASPPCLNVSKLELAISPSGSLFRDETRPGRKGCMARVRASDSRGCGLLSAPVGAMVAAPYSGTLMIRLSSFVAAALALLIAPAQAHPHVWVTMKSEVIYSADGTATGVRHAWTFDDMFSTFATQGLASKEKGKFTREELAPLAEVNVTSLKDFDYFTVARANGKKADLTAPVDYYLEFADGLLTLHFTLPLATPAKAQSLDFEMTDPTYFVEI